MDVPETDVHTTAAGQGAGAFVLDVRQPDEYHEVHARGAVLIPLAEVPERVDEIPSAGVVHVICRSGVRSAKAAAHLRSLGIDARNVTGGTLAWVDAGLPTSSGTDPG